MAAPSGQIREKAMSIEQQLREEGRQQGMEQGLQQGEKRGELIGTIQTLQQVLDLPVSDRAELAHKTFAELEPLAASLRARLTQSGA